MERPGRPWWQLEDDVPQGEEDQGHNPEYVDLPGQVGGDQRQRNSDPEEHEGDTSITQDIFPGFCNTNMNNVHGKTQRSSCCKTPENGP